MKLFRIAREKFIDDLSGEGARLYGGRWNKRGTNMLYLSKSLSLCLLEVLVHFNQQHAPQDLFYVQFDLPDKHINSDPDIAKIEANLRDNPPNFSTQQFGSQWSESNKDLALEVPSAILPIEKNVIVNPRHKLITKLKIVKTEKLDLDRRLFV